jgi:hypothetical protein
LVEREKETEEKHA